METEEEFGVGEQRGGDELDFYRDGESEVMIVSSPEWAA